MAVPLTDRAYAVHSNDGRFGHDCGLQVLLSGQPCIIDKIRFIFGGGHFLMQLAQRTPGEYARTPSQQRYALRSIVEAGNFAVVHTADGAQGFLLVPVIRTSKRDKVPVCKVAKVPFFLEKCQWIRNNEYSAVMGLQSIYCNEEIIEQDKKQMDKFAREHQSWGFHGYVTGMRTICGSSWLDESPGLEHSLIHTWWMHCQRFVHNTPSLYVN